MGFDGSGNYTRTNGTQTGSTLWQDRAAIAPATISASEHDAEMNDVATALTACLKADGSKTATNNQPMGGFKHTGVADATLANQYATLGQVQTGLTVNDLIVNANNATVGLRVTQTGSGEALRVEDSANPDSTPFVITAGGDVGIGTASPSVKLQVEGEAIFNINSANTGVRITQTGAGDVLRVEDATNPDTTPFVIKSDGKVGIGTTTPGSASLYVNGEMYATDVTGATVLATGTIKSSTDVVSTLHVAGDFNNLPNAGATTGTIRGSNSDGSVSNAPGGTIKIAGGRATGNAAGGPIVFETSAAGVSGFTVQTSTERVRIDNVGNVGVGTSSPSELLHLKSAAPRIRFEDSDAASTIYAQIGNNSTTGSLTLQADPGNATANSAIVFDVDNTERVRIDSSGNVGIGTNAPSTDLTVEKSANGNLGVSIRNTSAGTAAFSSVSLGNDTSATAFRLSCNSSTFTGTPGAAYDIVFNNAQGTNGNFIFRTASTNRLTIKNDGELIVSGSTDNGAYNLQCNGTGVWGAGAYVNGSDARIKDEINPIDECLFLVKALNPVTYRYKQEWSKDQAVQPGFIAQEIEATFQGKPYLQGIVQDGPTYKSLAYQNLIPVLTKALQELAKKVESLEAEISTLKGA